MSENLEAMIDSAMTQKPETFNQAFQAEIKDRLAGALEGAKEAVAQSILGDPIEEPETEVEAKPEGDAPEEIILTDDELEELLDDSKSEE